MDMVSIPDFSAGAMENWGLITYRVVDLLFDEKTAGASTKQRVAEVVQHELAHQWFGNLVTMDFWDGLWSMKALQLGCLGLPATNSFQSGTSGKVMSKEISNPPCL